MAEAKIEKQNPTKCCKTSNLHVTQSVNPTGACQEGTGHQVKLDIFYNKTDWNTYTNKL